jgi:CDP-diacylglycerol---glycerol-3-phosphate 3-phosphatidyltransferase
MIGQTYALPSLPTMVALGLAFFILTAYGVRTAIVGRARDQRVIRAGGTVLLRPWFLEAFYWSFKLPGRMFVRLGVSPDALTWTSLFISVLAAPAAALGHFSTSGLFVLVGSMFDSFDGLVARERKIASDYGEMLDAVIDRYADMAPLVGLTIFYRFSVPQMLVPLFVLVGSVMLSYVRAKSEALNLDLPSGLMRRHERITYVVVALMIGPELSRWLGSPFGIVHPATLTLLALVALIANVAATRLTLNARRALVRAGRSPHGDTP